MYIQLFIAQHIIVDLKDTALITETRTRMRHYVLQQHGTGEAGMNLFDILKFIFLFIAIWWKNVNTVKTIRGEAIPFLNFIIESIGITGFVYMQWLM